MLKTARFAFVCILITAWVFSPFAIRFDFDFQTNTITVSLSTDEARAGETTGAISCGTGSFDAGTGSDWGTASNGCDATDGTYATASVTGTGATDYFTAKNLNFSTIPSGSTLIGIAVGVERKTTTNGSNLVKDSSIKLIKTDGTYGAEDKSAGANWATSDTVATFGGSTDKWSVGGNTWVIGGGGLLDITDSGFGVAVKGVGASGTGSKTVTGSIDNITVTIYFVSPPGTFNQRATLFTNDNGGGVNGVSSSTIQVATSTIKGETIKGERMLVWFNIDNSGATPIGASTTAFRLQYENTTDAEGVWTNIGTTTDISFSLASTSVSNMIIATTSAPIVNSQCSSSGAYQAGKMYVNTATTTGIHLPLNDCIDIGFSLETSRALLGKTYTMRLVEAATSSTNLFTGGGGLYIAFATTTIESAESVQMSKGAIGTTTINDIAPNTQVASLAVSIGMNGFPVISSGRSASPGWQNIVTCLDIICSSFVQNDVKPSNEIRNDVSIIIGADGFPVLSVLEEIGGNAERLMVIKCNNNTCAEKTTNQITFSTDDIGHDTSIAIGADGLPIIAHFNQTANRLMITKCDDAQCSDALDTTTKIDNGSSNGVDPSIKIGADGYPVIAHDQGSSLAVTKCNDTACENNDEGTSVISVSGKTVGEQPSLAIARDGFPIIAHMNTTDNTLMVTKCNDDACSGGDETTTAITLTGLMLGIPSNPSLAIGSDLFAVISLGIVKSPSTLAVIKCNDEACAGDNESISQIAFESGLNDAAVNLGSRNQLMLAPDGLPLIVSAATSTSFGSNHVAFIKCNSLDCSNAATSSNANLASATSSPMSFFLDKQGYQNATSSNDVYDSYSAATSSIAFQWVTKNSNNTDEPSPAWEGHVTQSNNLYLQIFHFGSTNQWETLTSSTTPLVDTDMYLVGTASSSVSEYYDDSNRVHARMRMATSTGFAHLRTDSASTTFAAVVPAFNGSISSAFSQVFETGVAATSTPTITITPDSTTPSEFNTTDDIRIAIASSSVKAIWDTSVTSLTTSGQAVTQGHIANPVTPAYEGGNGANTVVMIPVSLNFDASTDSFTVSGLKYIASSTAVNAAANPLRLYKDGPADTGVDDTDDKTIAVKGGLRLTTHSSASQPSNKFNTSNISDEVLYNFRLEPMGESLTVSKIAFSITLFGVGTSDLSNFQIFPDYDGSGTVNNLENRAENQIGGTPAITTSAVTFSSSFATSTSMDYILEGDVSSINPGDEMTILLLKDKITSAGDTSSQTITATGTATKANHVRSGGSAISGGSGSSGPTVTDTSGATGGGGSGETLEETAGFVQATAVGTPANFWTSGSNGIGTDNSYASETTNDEGLNFNNFNFSIPSTDTIKGIEVKIEANCVSCNSSSIDVALTWDNDGTNATTTAKNSGSLTTTDTVYTFGSNVDTWGRTWSASTEFTNGNFSIEVSSNPGTGGTVRIDNLTIKVYSQAEGGGGGGGGRSQILPGLFSQFASILEGLRGLADSLVEFLR